MCSPTYTSPTVGNMTTNYFHHRREHAIEMRAREGKPAGAYEGRDKLGPALCVCICCAVILIEACIPPAGLFRRPGGEGPQGRNATTDDMIYNRFHKRNRR